MPRPTQFPSDEADCASWEVDYWASRIVAIAAGQGDQPLVVPCSWLPFRDRIVAAQAQLAQAMTYIDQQCDARPSPQPSPEVAHAA